MRAAPKSTLPKIETHRGTKIVGARQRAKKAKAATTLAAVFESSPKGIDRSKPRDFKFMQRAGKRTDKAYGIAKKNGDKDELPAPWTKNLVPKKYSAEENRENKTAAVQ